MQHKKTGEAKTFHKQYTNKKESKCIKNCTQTTKTLFLTDCSCNSGKHRSIGVFMKGKNSNRPLLLLVQKNLFPTEKLFKKKFYYQHLWSD